MTDRNAVADVLDDAADYIERNGWTQGQMIEGDRRCALGAIGVVTHALPRNQWQIDTESYVLAMTVKCSLEDRLPDRRDGGIRTVANWNDQPGRTEQEVLDAFRAAAKAERKLADGIEP